MHVGLGLSISQKLLALIDSNLTVNSKLGKGSCFSFELPLVVSIE
ncbi:ATP-binding protein [uncultured Paraglaciecola sp.]|nr:ATP-binding protein [uncultured Paraglaciecola sp.]